MALYLVIQPVKLLLGFDLDLPLQVEHLLLYIELKLSEAVRSRLSSRFSGWFSSWFSIFYSSWFSSKW